MINDRILELRKSLRLTQKDFGEKLGLSQTHIASLEKNKRKATQRICNDICRVFDVRADWLINGNPPMHEDILERLDIDDEIKELAAQYTQLSEGDKNLVRTLVNSLWEKWKP